MLLRAIGSRHQVKLTQIFADNSIEAVTIDNNHSFDYGDTGFEDTKTALDNAGVDWGYKDKVIYYEKDGFTLAVVCVSFYSEQEAYDHMQYLEAASANSDFQVVYFHGGTEGVHQPDGWKQSVCHAFVDNGADLVIGSHPHVLRNASSTMECQLCILWATSASAEIPSQKIVHSSISTLFTFRMKW